MGEPVIRKRPNPADLRKPSARQSIGATPPSTDPSHANAQSSTPAAGVRPADVSDAASATTTADQRKISRGRSADGEEKKSTGDYEVGYGRPPKHSQFPNQHQNKKGRPRKVQNFLTIVEREMDGKVTVLEGEKTRTITKRELAAKRFVNRVVEGDPKALDRWERHEAARLLRQQKQEEQELPATLDEHETSALANFTALIRASILGDDQDGHEHG
jgi:hypothetical protein